MTNGWRTVGSFIWNVLPVQELGWLAEREPDLYEIAEEAENEESPFHGESDDSLHDEYRDEQGTRVKRSLVVTSDGDASTWLLDPEVLLADGEWEGGRWSSWNPAMSWHGSSFAGLMRDEHRFFLDRRS